MAKAQAKKAPVKVQTKIKPEVQADNMVFALDIGTRSIIGMVGVVEEDRVKIIAIEKEEHSERAMIDGQIENIAKVSALAKKVKRRLESRLQVKLKRVSVAAAGRALRTSRVEYEMQLQGVQLINDEVINRLEAGAISKAEERFDAENEAQEDSRRFYLVGYTVCQYYLDQYMISSLKDHRGKHIKVDLIATFLPSEVVESLYTTMNKIGLEVSSITLEPIAAINAAIPENLRLLNLVIVDIGAGTSDIAACTGGSVTGYTMATIAGDEITEAIMKEFLVDFLTAENMKAQIEHEEEVTFTDILGFERKATKEEVFRCIQDMSGSLCSEIAAKILEVNGTAPSALFLAGGGSKLAGIKDGLTAALQMDTNRVAIAGNNFRVNAFSEEYDLNSPEYATPLGIAISSGLNLINDSFRVVLNGKSAKLFRSGSFTIMNLLMMNGYGFQDMLGRSGLSVSVRVNGKRKVFYGTAAQPASLFINRKEGKLSDIVHAGDNIEFVPAVNGRPATPLVKDIEGAAECLELTLNGQPADLETPLKNGDIIMMMLSDEQIAARKREAEEREAAAAAAREAAKGQADEEKVAEGRAVEEEVAEEQAVEEREAVLEEEPEEEIADEEELTEEEMDDAEEVTGAEVKSGEEEMPGAEAKSGAEEMPGAEAKSGTEKKPGAEVKSGMEKMPGAEVKSSAEAKSGTKEMPGAEAKFGMEKMPGAEVKSGMEKMPGAEAKSGTKEMPGAEVKSGVKEMPGAEAKSGAEEMAGVEAKSWTDEAGLKLAEQETEISSEAELPETEFIQEEAKSRKPGLSVEEGKMPERVLPSKEGKMSERVLPSEEAELPMPELMAEEVESPELELMAEEAELLDAELPIKEPEKVISKAKTGDAKRTETWSMVQETLDLGMTTEKRAAAGRNRSRAGKAPAARTETILFYLNDKPLRLPLKKNGDFYYLMDLIEYSGIDLKQPKGRVILSVNGEPGIFMQKLAQGDRIQIVEEES